MIKKILLLLILSSTFVVYAKEDKGIKIVCLGDSITLAKRVKPKESFIGLLGEKFKKEAHPVQFKNAGIGGDTTAEAIRRLNQTVLAFQPDIVTIMFGCNDSYKTGKMKESRIPLEQYKKNLNIILDSLKQNEVIPVLMTTPPTLTKNNIVEPYVEAVRNIAKKRNILLVDHFQAWQDYKNKGNKFNKILFDIAHPNQTGYIIMAKTMYPVLLDAVRKVKSKPEQINLAFGKKYTCSDKHPSPDWNAGLTDGKKTAQDADGKMGGFATGRSPEFPKEVVIDLEKNFPVNTVLVYNMKKYGTKTVEVSLSKDGKTFKKASSQKFRKADGGVYKYNFSQEEARFVKIVFLDYYKTSLNSNYMFLREVEVF